VVHLKDVSVAGIVHRTKF